MTVIVQPILSLNIEKKKKTLHNFKINTVNLASHVFPNPYDFLSLDTKLEILKNVHAMLSHTMKVNSELGKSGSNMDKSIIKVPYKLHTNHALYSKSFEVI